METIKQLVLQTMIRLLEPEVFVQVREDDQGEVEGMVSDLQDEYAQFMQEKTGREYTCNVSIYEHPLTEDMDENCGGVVVYSQDKRIWC